MDFRAAYLEDKFWTRSSVLVPGDKVVLDERFDSVDIIFRDHVERENFEIFWLEYGIIGNVRLLGDYNYAYIDGFFYHLEKVRNQGFVKNGEGVESNAWDYYIEYDDWMNDWLNDRVDICGTISKTGDINIAKANIVQISPLIQGTNSYKILIGKSQEESLSKDPGVDAEKTLIILESSRPPSGEWINPSALTAFNNVLATYSWDTQTPDPTNIKFPAILWSGYYDDWKNNIFYALKDLSKRRFKIYDIKKSNINLNTFKSKYHLSEVYVIAPNDYTSYLMAQTENAHVRLKNDELNLAGFNLIPLDDHLLPKQVNDRGIKFSEILSTYKAKYTNISDDDGWFLQIALNIFLSYFPVVARNTQNSSNLDVLGGDRISKVDYDVRIIQRPTVDQRYFKNHGINDAFLWWEQIAPDNIFTSRIIARNFLFQPNTPKLYIAFLREIGTKKLTPGKTYSIGQDEKFTPKNPASWFSTRRIDELMAWLNWLNTSYTNEETSFLKPTFDKNSDNPIKFNYDSIHGSVGLVDLSKWKLINREDRDINKFNIHRAHEIDSYNSMGVGLIPDYSKNRWVLAQFRTISGIKNLYEVKDSFVNERFQRHQYLLIDELGKVQKVNQAKENWRSPRTDDYLGAYIPKAEKYAFIIPNLLMDAEGSSKFSTDSYNYKFGYVNNISNNMLQTAGFGMVYTFQFPLAGCGFDIYAELQKHLTNGDVSWYFVCDKRIKDLNSWSNKGESPYAGDIVVLTISNGFVHALKTKKNEPEDIKDSLVNYNECVQINIWTLGGANREASKRLVHKLWGWFFGFRWDGSYNGAIYLGNTQKNYLSWAKPFNKRWYICQVHVSNYINYKNGIGYSETQLLYGKNSSTWNPKDVLYGIGYDDAGRIETSNVTTWHHVILNAGIQTFSIKQSSGHWEDHTPTNTDRIPPEKFTYYINQYEHYTALRFVMGKINQNLPYVGTGGEWMKTKTWHPNTYPNPSHFNPAGSLSLDVSSIDGQNQSALNWDEQLGDIFVPMYIAAIFGADKTTSQFRLYSNPTSSLSTAIEDFKVRFESEINMIHSLVTEQHLIFDMEGTEFICFARLNIRGEYEFEFISKTNNSIEKQETTHETFLNPTKDEDTEETFIKRVNSLFEVCVYGQRIPLKTRPDITLDEIDIGFTITPINDPKQSETSLWYLVEIKTDQDVQRIRIEVPKEINAMNISAPYERENILRQISYHAKDRILEKEQFLDDRQKYNFDMGLKSQRIDITRNRELTNEIIGMANTTIQAGHAVAAGGVGGLFTGGAAFTLAGYATSIAGQALNMTYSKQLYDLNRQEHAEVAAYGARSLDRKGQILSNKHEDAQAMDRLAILNMQTNMAWPSNTDALMFRQENKQFNLSDVYLIQYSPEGRQLEFLKNYYKEYGFDLIAPNIKCHGISFIHRHIKYTKITRNVYHNETIRQMIEDRALNGITVIYKEDNINPQDIPS